MQWYSAMIHMQRYAKESWKLSWPDFSNSFLLRRLMGRGRRYAASLTKAFGDFETQLDLRLESSLPHMVVDYPRYIYEDGQYQH